MKLFSLQNSVIFAWHFSEGKKSTFTESEQKPPIRILAKLKFPTNIAPAEIVLMKGLFLKNQNN